MSDLIEVVKIPAVKAVPERKEKRVTGTICGFCRRDTRNRPDHTGTVNWADNAYNIQEVTISLKEGSRYPEGGSGELLRFDVCLSCFQEELIPWFAARGIMPEETDWDF